MRVAWCTRPYMHPVVVLVTAEVEMDVLDLTYAGHLLNERYRNPVRRVTGGIQ
jgi:hypothetical protein